SPPSSSCLAYHSHLTSFPTRRSSDLTFELVKAIDFHGDVDNLRYDAPNQRVYVGFGDDESGAIGTVDATTNERLDEEYKLGAHRSEEHTSELQSRVDLVCRLLLEKKK